MQVTETAYQVLEKPVKPMGTTGGIYLPISWVGKRVKILLMDPVTHEEVNK